MSDPGRTDQLDRDLADQGFATRPLLPRPVVDELTDLFVSLDVASSPTVHRTFIDASRAVATKVDRRIRDLVAAHVGQVLPARDVALATFVHKRSHDGPVIDMHQDLTFTDERLHRGIALWIPLIDVDADEGALAVIPGSHRWSSGIRTHSDVVPSATITLQDELAAEATTLPLGAGSAVVYDSATVHGSATNTSSHGRPAIVVVTVPRGAPILHFVEDEHSVRGFEVDSSYFCTQEFGRLPVGYREIVPWTGPVPRSDLVAHLGCRS